MKIVAHGTSDVGRVRKHNEDNFLVDPEIGLYVVCDGMGGHAAGEVASQTAAETVRDYLRQRRDVLEAVAQGRASTDEVAGLLRHGIQSASARIYELAQADPRRKGMGTTCCAIVVVGPKAVLGHVGDSRCYLHRDSRVYQLSEDHTYVQEAIRRGLMTPEQAAESGHTNLVTRAVGPSPSVLVDTLVFDILAGDTLLLCTDGLHNYVNGSAELAVSLAPEKLEDIAQQLIATANDRGGSDNISTVLVRASATAPEAAAQSARASRVTEELAALGHIALFRELDMKEIVKVANRCEHLELAPGEVVMSEGDASDALFVIVSGGAFVYRGNQELAVLRSGDHFGEMALLSRRPRTATIRTRKKTRLLRLDRERFYEIMQQDAVLAAKFLWKLAQTLTVRLDDVYTLRDAERESDGGGRPTQTYGLFPSPFDGR